MRIAVAFARQAARTPQAELCTTCVDVLQVGGAGVTLMSGRHTGPVCSSSERTSVLEDLQFTLGEGPCRDAYLTGQPVHEPELDRSRDDRWPNFAGAAVDVGVRGVFAFPLSAGNTRIGVLTLYQDKSGSLSHEQTADSLVLAEVLTQTMLTMQARAGPDRLAIELADAAAHRAEVHQASGMVAVQLGVDVVVAMDRLRAFAYGTEQSVASVASDVVARRLRMDDDRYVGGAAC